MLVEKKPRTYEQMCIDKLRELGNATAAEWADAMGYNRPNALAKVIKRILREYSEQIEVTCIKKPRRYKAL